MSARRKRKTERQRRKLRDVRGRRLEKRINEVSKKFFDLMFDRFVEIEVAAFPTIPVPDKEDVYAVFRREDFKKIEKDTRDPMWNEEPAVHARVADVLRDERDAPLRYDGHRRLVFGMDYRKE